MMKNIDCHMRHDIYFHVFTDRSFVKFTFWFIEVFNLILKELDYHSVVSLSTCSFFFLQSLVQIGIHVAGQRTRNRSRLKPAQQKNKVVVVKSLI